MTAYAKVAAPLSQEKIDHPDRFCVVPRCLWRTHGGTTPCEEHPRPLTLAQRLERSITAELAKKQCEVCHVTLGSGPNKCQASAVKPTWCVECAMTVDERGSEEVDAESDCDSADRSDYYGSLGVR